MVATSELAALHKRLRKLVHRVTVQSAQDVSQLVTSQFDLARLQRDIQAEIGQAKRGKDRELLPELRQLRRHSRRLGDAIAFQLLGSDLKLIEPLSRNAPTPISQLDHGRRGEELVTIGLSGKEHWGVPILHGVTDVLRIGDVSFLTPSGEEHRSISVRTIEIKTKVTEEKEEPDGSRTVTYRSQATWVGDGGENAPLSAPGPTESGARPSSPQRLDQQMRRMHRARFAQTAVAGRVYHHPGEEPPTLVVAAERAGRDDGVSLRKMLRTARRHGFASMSVDNGTLYVALYSRDGFDGRPVVLEQVAPALVESGLLSESTRLSASLLVLFLAPEEQSRQPMLHRPFFLWEVPFSTKVDIIMGRMLVIALVNTALVVDKIEAAGFTVSNPSGKLNLGPGSLVFSAASLIPDGSARADIHNFESRLIRMIFEFGRVEDIVSELRAVQATAELHSPFSGDDNNSEDEK